MILLTLCILCTSFFSICNCFEISQISSSILGDNVVVLIVVAAFGTISLIGACALCFRRKKTFEKLENEAGSPENSKKNEYPIFRALATEVNESTSAAIVPCERNNLSRDNLLNSSDNLNTDDSGSIRRSDGIDSSDVVLLEKPLSSMQCERSQKISRDTITYETEKKHQSPSSKTPLLYAKNVQSYQESQPINEQIQQKSVSAVFLSSTTTITHESTLKSFYNAEKNDVDNLETKKIDKANEFISLDEETKGCTSTSSASLTNPFFNSTVEDCTVKENTKDDASEIESSINDNSEKYQILEEETETDVEDIKNIESSEDLPLTLYRQNSKGSNCSSGDKSVEEALRALDIAIGFDDDDDEDDDKNIDVMVNIEKLSTIHLDEVKEEATFLVDSIVNDCEKILEEKQVVKLEIMEDVKKENEIAVESCFEDFLSLQNKNISTPCNIKLQPQISYNLDVGKVLFPTGVDLTDDMNDTFPISPNINNTFDVSQAVAVNNKTFEVDVPEIKIEKDKDEISSEDLTTVTPVNTPIELSYSSETWDKLSYGRGAISKQQQQQSNTEAQCKTPDDEEEEDNCGGAITFNHDGWYLHPQSKSDTFEICDDEEDGNMEDMSSTFDQLRRQLTEMLPHAQGMSTHNDFLDDDLNKDSNSPSDDTNYGVKYGELDEASNAGSFDLMSALLNPQPVTELNINYNNYKRPLSPIMEESECDETCRTFVMNNETKLLDSTSTGIMESASVDAIMGQVPKALMASNDTLFNFEDTLSDQTDLLMSPRMHTAGSSSSSTLSRQESHDRISNERTPTNEELPKISSSDMSSSTKSQELDAIDILKNNIRQHPLSLDLNPIESSVAANTKYELAKLALEEGSWPLELPEAQQIINDLSSPEQNRTADSLSFEQDVTYTIDDQKTCVSFVLKNDDERISEISEPLFASESLDVFADDDDDDKANSLLIDDAISLDTDPNFNYEINDENGNQSAETMESEICIKEIEATNFDNDSINPMVEKNLNYDIDSLEAEQKILNDEIEADSIPASQISKSVYSNDSINENETNNSVQNSDSSESDCVAVIKNNEQDSSEDSEGSDKKKGSSQDIRQVSCNQSIMTTSFTKEWSDDDSSHSSEEFMYVKGHVEKIASPIDEQELNNNVEESNNEQSEDVCNENVDNIEEVEVTEMNAWKNLKIQKAPGCEEDESNDDEEDESEFVPSCWDQSLQPQKSSLKSPEKESTTTDQESEQQKTRRRVAFKVQRYHSVYEYPSEVVQLSPAYSEPQLWSNYLDDGDIDYFAYTNQLSDMADINGFNISSSSRPFHSNNHSPAMLHNTWPNENDFSWSQFQDSNDIDDSEKTDDIPFKIEWPIRKSMLGTEEDDSGLCESSESPSIGELNYTKNSLRLPLELVSSTSSEVSDFLSTDIVTKDLEAVKIEISNEESLLPKKMLDHDDEYESDKMNDSILPTPLSGSMDSLSSNSQSASSNTSSSPSFTTFGKDKILKDTLNTGKTSIIFIEDNTQLDSNGKMKYENVEAIENGKVTLGSSDDDSGFENVQIKCEAK